MNGAGRALMVAEMQARELLRRRAVLILFVLLPASWYYSVPPDQSFGLTAASMGLSWPIAAAGMFGMLGWRRADQRLALAGAAPYQGLIGRLLVLQGLGLVLVALFAPQILWHSSSVVTDPSLVVLSLVLMAMVSVPLGLAIGALMPRELEGMLVLIGVIGLGTSLVDSAIAHGLPMWGPLETMRIAAGLSDGSVGRAVVHALVSTVLLLGVAYLLWRRRVRIHV